MKLFSLGAACVVLVIAARAQAQTCGPNDECPSGYTCVSKEVAVPTPACPPDMKCPTPQPTVEVYKACQPRTCETDSDCGGTTVCHAETSTACSGGSVATPCAPDTKCEQPAPTPSTCTTTTNKVCAFKWALPCSTAAECGDGFDCHPTEIGSCSGSSPSRDGTPPPAPMCTTTVSYPGYCAPRKSECTADTDCPADWKCGANNTVAVSSPPSGPNGEPNPTPPPATTPAPRSCTSPFGGVTRGGTVAPGVPTMGEGGASVPPVASPVPASDSQGSGNASGGPGVTPAPTSPTSTSLSSNAGCSVGGGQAGGLSVLLVLGLALLRRRRVS